MGNNFDYFSRTDPLFWQFVINAEQPAKCLTTGRTMKRLNALGGRQDPRLCVGKASPDRTERLCSQGYGISLSASSGRY
jgi:hypothetical protein